MSLLNWNYRGFENPQIVNVLKKVIRIEKCNFVFLMETKSDVKWMKIVRERCGFKDGFSYPSKGASGGLALFWDSDIKVQVMSSAVSYIDALVEGGSKFGR